VESICEESDELRKAAFWVLLRQDILWVSIAPVEISYAEQGRSDSDGWIMSQAEKHRRPTIIDVTSCFVTTLDLESPTSDEMWANRIYYLLAKVINFAFGRPGATSDEQRQKEGKELEAAVERWRSNLPPGFQPFWYAEADEGELNPFPSICEWRLLHFADSIEFIDTPSWPQGLLSDWHGEQPPLPSRTPACSESD
jgi:hypothetical protein